MSGDCKAHRMAGGFAGRNRRSCNGNGHNQQIKNQKVGQ